MSRLFGPKHSSKKISNVFDRKLLILDVNGLLCYRLYFNYGERIEEEILRSLKQTGLEYFFQRHYLCILRPFVKLFLEQCYSMADVGFFSSMTPNNGHRLLNKILSPRQLDQTKFIWFRDKTQKDLDSENPEMDTVKNIANIFKDPTINPGGKRYGFHNTVICDDSIIKTRYNPIENVQIVTSYKPLDFDLIESLDRFSTELLPSVLIKHDDKLKTLSISLYYKFSRLEFELERSKFQESNLEKSNQ